ncbi:UDP-N-acetylmuramoyl-L-alanyl-D-glutamate--2,6-diaminopimelate ligase [Thermodesulfobacteriota bacterium]
MNSAKKSGMTLKELLDGFAPESLEIGLDTDVKGIAYDSRKLKPGYLFVALEGREMDGHNYIHDAIERGAIAVVFEHDLVDGVDSGVPMVKVSNSREVLSKLAVKYFRYPFEGMNLIGITGTNGKTTTSYILESILEVAGKRPGVIGTVNDRYGDEIENVSVTTPESLELMRTLRRMSEAGVTDVIMEVSSHALDQGRTNDCPFKVVVFTNISRDHLDYHNSMNSYFESKTLLFKKRDEIADPEATTAVINADDPRGRELIKITDFPCITFGLSKSCDVRAENVRIKKEGLYATIVTPSGVTDIKSNLIGNFNIYNILSASAAALCLGIEMENISSGISILRGVPGRLELVGNNLSKTIVVDYAHTPDALLKVLLALKPLYSKIITVFGCGGDRDRGKRRQMGLVAGEHSNFVIITSDNPRTEEPMAIAMEVEEGVREAGLRQYEMKSVNTLVDGGYILNIDRKSAIKQAVSLADENAMILIAGKGHEDYQILGKEKIAFDDRKVAAEAASGVS